MRLICVPGLCLSLARAKCVSQGVGLESCPTTKLIQKQSTQFEVYNRTVSAWVKCTASLCAVSVVCHWVGWLAEPGCFPKAVGDNVPALLAATPEGGLLGNLGGLVSECGLAVEFSQDSPNTRPCKAGVSPAPIVGTLARYGSRAFTTVNTCTGCGCRPVTMNAANAAWLSIP